MADNSEDTVSEVQHPQKTADIIPDCLSQIGRAADGISHAYVKLEIKVSFYEFAQLTRSG